MESSVFLTLAALRYVLMCKTTTTGQVLTKAAEADAARAAENDGNGLPITYDLFAPPLASDPKFPLGMPARRSKLPQPPDADVPN